MFALSDKNNMKEFDLNFPTCPIRNVLSRFSDKWSLLIMVTLQSNDKMRYKDLRKCIPDISHKMLTISLRKLEGDHLLTRRAYAEIPPRVEYSLTEMGKSIMPAIHMMTEWAQVHFEEYTR